MKRLDKMIQKGGMGIDRPFISISVESVETNSYGKPVLPKIVGFHVMDQWFGPCNGVCAPEN